MLTFSGDDLSGRCLWMFNYMSTVHRTIIQFTVFTEGPNRTSGLKHFVAQPKHPVRHQDNVLSRLWFVTVDRPQLDNTWPSASKSPEGYVNKTVAEEILQTRVWVDSSGVKTVVKCLLCLWRCTLILVMSSGLSLSVKYATKSRRYKQGVRRRFFCCRAGRIESKTLSWLHKRVFGRTHTGLGVGIHQPLLHTLWLLFFRLSPTDFL